MLTRKFFRTGALWLACGSLVAVLNGLNAAESQSRLDSSVTNLFSATSMKALRQVAAERRRRIIFNNDGGETAVLMKSPSAQELLDLRTTPLLGSQVDSIFYCTRSSGFSLFTHHTKVGQIAGTTEGRYTNNQTVALLKAGIDPLRVISDFCKQHQMEFFWSMRMNDTHDGSPHEYGPIMFRENKLKQTHPEFLLGSPTNKPKYGAWTAVNYALPEIRELAFRYVEEICTNYDVDGIELDFYRHPVFFPSTARGKLATDAECAAMTELLHRIRAMADNAGRKRGRPILMAIHCPDSIEYCRAIGLDLENWFANDLLDLWIPGGTFQLNDWEYSVALARKVHVKVYPSLDDPRVKDDTAKQMRMTLPAYRARAARVWAAGADGVYLFNVPDVKQPVWQKIGDPQELAEIDKDYFASDIGLVGSAGGNYPLKDFATIEQLNPGNSKTIAPGNSATARLKLAEDFSATTPKNLMLRLRFKSPPDTNALEVTINNRAPKLLRAEGEWLDFSVQPADLKRGDNLVKVQAPSAATATYQWLDLLLEVRASAAEPSGASLAFTMKDSVVTQALELMNSGKFSAAETFLAANTNKISEEQFQTRSEALEIIRRTRYEYSLDADALLAKVKEIVPDATAAEVARWASESKARFRMIDGKKFFFRREPRNIFLFCKDAADHATRAGNPPTTESKTRNHDHLAAIIAEAERTGAVEVQPVHHKVTHTITIRSNTLGVKAGSLVRAWLPFAQEYRQQKKVKLISASPEPKLISPNDVDGNPVTGGAQRSIYFEQRVEAPAKPIEFKVVFDYTFYAYYPQLDVAKVQPLPADWNGANLGERPPHIVFTPEIRQQVNEIIGSETNSLAKVQKIFHWVSDNVPWCAEDEYCIIPSLALKGFTARQGDCGVQNTVFITMCRIAGIPARWQSGFETKPFDDWGMHDWAEIYLAPWGWLPADASYGVQESSDPRIADFFLGHQDSYRLIVNLDWGRELFPPKKSFRSEPADFQRGEVEVDGQNLYFDQWENKTKVERTPVNQP